MNIIERLINIVVNNRKANAELKNTEKALNNVDKETKNVTNSQKSLTDTVTKNGGAMKILNQLTGGLAGSFKDAFDASKLFIGGLNGIKGAIAATGIGALVVFLPQIISGFKSLLNTTSATGISSEDITKQQEKLNKLLSEAEESEQKRAIAAKDREITIAKEKGDIQETNRLEKEKLELAKDFLETRNESLKSQRAVIKLTEQEQEIYNEFFSSYQKAIKDIERLPIEIERLENAPFFVSKSNLDNLRKQLTEAREIKETFEKTNPVILKKIELSNQINDTEENIKNIKNEQLLISIRENAEQQARLERVKQIRAEIDKLIKTQKDASQNLVVDDATRTGGFFSGLVQNYTRNFKLINDAIENIKARQKELIAEGSNITAEQAKQLKTLESSLESLEGQLKTQVEFYKSEFSPVIDRANEEFQEQIRTLSNLQLEYSQLGNVIFEFEKGFEKNGKWLDDRVDNSNKFLEIQENLIKIYEKEQEIILQNQLIANNVFLSRFEDITQEINKVEELLKSEILTFEQRARLEAQLLDLNNQSRLIEQEQLTSDANFKNQLVLSTYNFEIETAFNTAEQKRLIREEELEREQIYYNSIVDIAEESQNLLSSLASQGDKNSRKFAEAALKLQKAAGVARVAIATQEEIRGIWSNPALTALPDTGIAKKKLLTAGALVRAGLSTAAILSQKLSSPSANIGGQGAQGAPQFNVVEASGTNQLAATIAAQQQQPINAYVVGQDVTTQQALDRNRITNATFLFWVPFIFISSFLMFI
jgi:hypothetical protein